MIRIQNVYYMLAYAFQTLNEQGYKKLATEDFENTADLFAAILSLGIKKQIKRGLGREYLPLTEPLSTLRGKIDITESIKTQTTLRKQMICSYDDFSINSYMNRIIKSTVDMLMKSDIPRSRKKELKKLMVYFADVDLIDLHTVNWNFRYNRNNLTYRMLIAICFLAVKGLLQTQSDGTSKIMDFLDEQRMCRLYERFILEYYRREHPELSANASRIQWQLDDDNDDMLPGMQTDIMLKREEKTLIIDAKYYSHSLQKQYDRRSIHSSNLYQIFTYVKNKTVEMNKEKEAVGGKAVDPVHHADLEQVDQQKHTVKGMLLYAKTDEDIVLDNDYQMSGNCISVRTLDLNADFQLISGQLDKITEEFFG